MNPRKTVTMKEIAVRVGLTQAAVSLALGGKPGVSDATRDRVRAVARQLGYQKDAYTSALMAGRKRSRESDGFAGIAFVTAFATPDAWKEEPAIAASFAGAAERALENGYKLEPFWLGREGALAGRVSHALFTRNIRAVLIAPLPDGLDTLSMRWEHFQTIALGFSLAHPAVSRISCDHIQSMTLACAHCQSRGYARPGLVLTRAAHEHSDRRWLAAFTLAQQRLSNTSPLPPLLIESEDDPAFSHWLEREKPDVILTHIGTRIYNKLLAMGRRIPKEMGVVDLELTQAGGQLSGICKNPRVLGARAIDFLRTGLARREFAAPSQSAAILVDGIWIPGRTLRHGAGEGGSVDPVLPPVRPSALQRPSMRDVARRAGVDPATVSRSLREDARISEATKKRVLAAARELGYRKHPYITEFMRRARTGSARASRPRLAFLTAFQEPDGWRKSESIFQEFYHGAVRRAHELGYQLEEVWHATPLDGRTLSDALSKRNVQGVIVAPLPHAGTTIDLRWDRFCVMALGTTLASPGVHRIVSDAYNSMRLAVQKGRELGYKRIAMVASAALDARVHGRWSAAFLMLRSENPHDLLPLCLMPDEKWDKPGLDRWRNEMRPDLILSPNPIESWLELRPRRRSPGPVGYVSLNCQRDGWITGIDQSGELLGAHAADTLVGLIERDEYGLPGYPNTIFLNGLWNPGTTAHPLREPPVTP